VARATATAAELEREEFRAGRGSSREGNALRPQWVAVVGIGAYRAAFGRPKALIGPQEERLGRRDCGSCRSRAVSTPIISCRSSRRHFARCAKR